jgi:rhamnosyltransferase
VLDAIFKQKVAFEFEVIVVDSTSHAADVERMRRFPIVFQQIAPEQFGHGRTRNLMASMARGELLLFLSQDAQPADEFWMDRLTSPLLDSAVAGSYARQIPRQDADPMIRFFLAHTYDGRPARRRIHSRESVRIDQIFFSNVSSAMRRDVWQEFPFRPDLVMSEDQYWAYDVLRAGHDLVYEPAARVFHSHNYSLRTLFWRNWDSGASLRGLIADSPAAIAQRGLGYVLGQASYLVANGRAHWLPYMLVYEATKAAGFSMGMRFGQQRA